MRVWSSGFGRGGGKVGDEDEVMLEGEDIKRGGGYTGQYTGKNSNTFSRCRLNQYRR